MNLSEQVNKDNKYIADYVGNTFWPNVSFHEDWNSLIAVMNSMEADFFDFYYLCDRDSEPSFSYEWCIYDSKERIPRVRMVGNYKINTLHAAIGEALRRLAIYFENSIREKPTLDDCIINGYDTGVTGVCFTKKGYDIELYKEKLSKWQSYQNCLVQK